MNKPIDIKIKTQFLNFLILGFLLIIAGGTLIFQAQYIGILLVIIGLLIVTSKKGLKVDTKNRRIKYYSKFAFKEFGKWIEIKNIQYIALMRVTVTQQINAITVPGKYTDTQVKLSFVMDKKKIIPIITDRKKKIMPIAEKIAKGFNVKVFDNSEGKKVWVDYSS